MIPLLAQAVNSMPSWVAATCAVVAAIVAILGNIKRGGVHEGAQTTSVDSLNKDVNAITEKIECVREELSGEIRGVARRVGEVDRKVAFLQGRLGIREEGT